MCFGKGTSTLVYAKSREEIGEWLKRLAITDSMLFAGVPPDKFSAIHCDKDDCKPRPKTPGSLDDFLRNRVNGWWRIISSDDDLV